MQSLMRPAGSDATSCKRGRVNVPNFSEDRWNWRRALARMPTCGGCLGCAAAAAAASVGTEPAGSVHNQQRCGAMICSSCPTNVHEYRRSAAQNAAATLLTTQPWNEEAGWERVRTNSGGAALSDFAPKRCAAVWKEHRPNLDNRLPRTEY